MKKTDVPKHPLKPAGKIKKGKKSLKVPDSVASDAIIIACPKPNNFRKAVRRKLIRSIKAYKSSKPGMLYCWTSPNDAKRVREFQGRRKILKNLIVKRKTFFFSEIEKDFSDATGGYRCVDPFTPLRRYIYHLEEIGLLRRKMDRYTFIE